MRRVAVIMAGGRGERLWPHSRARLPKQFLSLGGGPTFLQQTYARVADADAVLVLTSAATVDLVRQQLPHLPAECVLGEPLPRDTAATAAMAAAMSRVTVGGETVLALVPADHAVFDPDRFRSALKVAWAEAEREDCPVLLGIPPTRPETAYGYIERGQRLTVDGEFRVYRVERFVEKPTIERATEYLTSGRHLWNSGVCVCRTDVLLGILALYQPALHGLAEALWTAGGRAEAISERMALLPPISLDYAVLERVERTLVVETPLAWDDVGSWEALGRLYPEDERGNVSLGPAVLSDTERTTVYSAASGRLVVTHGVRDLVVVDTPDSILVAERGALHGMRQALAAVRASGFTSHLEAAMHASAPVVAPEAWGYSVALGDQGIRVFALSPGGALPSAAVEGQIVELLWGTAEFAPGTGSAGPLQRGRPYPVSQSEAIVSPAGCVLAVTPVVAATEEPAVRAPTDCRIVEKPWGRELWWAVGSTYAGKWLEVRAGHALSLQYHERKHETLYFLSGQVSLRLGDEEVVVGPGCSAVVPPGTIHRLEAITDAVIVEASTADLDDVVRLDDRYGRVGR